MKGKFGDAFLCRVALNRVKLSEKPTMASMEQKTREAGGSTRLEAVAGSDVEDTGEWVLRHVLAAGVSDLS